MAADIATLRPYLHDFKLTDLMVEGLGWNHTQSPSIEVTAGEETYSLHPLVEKAGFPVYRCSPNPDGAIPNQNIRRQIERQVTQTNYEHLIIFVDVGETRQVWQWVKRESGKPTAWWELPYNRGQTGTALLQRLRGIGFTLAEEGNLGITDVTDRFRGALDVERVTKAFYKRFENELTAFQKFIDGFTALGDRDWYASLMLNRMMFVYFIQKQGFLDGDEHYLRNRLTKVQEREGPDRFQRFYRQFLLRLFHEGLGKPESERSAELNALLGRVPYLNGGIFDPHQLERDYPDIKIPDGAFEQIFVFFDQYHWHLDDRPTGADNEINPDVLGYIFEKYVNRKQMGAYYTKEDITGYIARNTVIPRLLEMAQRECPIAFGADGGVWRLLQDDPDNYIHPAVAHGVAWDYSPENLVRLEEPLELPEHIAAGLTDTAQRGDWNQAAPPEFALPSETWRELIARRQRYAEVHEKLAAGEVQNVNDLITLNLDSERFARDVIVNSDGSDLVRAIWDALSKISVLDPACGSGAFLFAALNILEPLYSATMQAMRDFLADLETSKRQRPPRTLQFFRDVLREASKHRNERYYVLKSIIVNNLYGVDIMEEAVEICRLRLFLKLAAQLESYNQIEPLPDIDFNIQAGNTLVGFTSLADVERAMTITDNVETVRLPGRRRPVAGQQFRALDEGQRQTLARIEDKAKAIARDFRNFQWVQTEFGIDPAELAESKQGLQSKLNDLRGELDTLLAKEYGVDSGDAANFQQWLAGHQPFHWFVEFHGIMTQGGFDVVVGNPPYVEYRTVKDLYSVRGLTTEKCANLYAMMMERSLDMMKRGRFGMIVPVSGACTDGFAPLRDILTSAGEMVVSHFNDRPSRLFDGIEHCRLSVFLLNVGFNAGRVFSTPYNKWQALERGTLFQRLAFIESSEAISSGLLPKLGSFLEPSILRKFHCAPSTGKVTVNKYGQETIFYTRKLSSFVQILDFIPEIYDDAGKLRKPSELKQVKFDCKLYRDSVLAFLNSTLFYWLVTLFSDCRNLNKREIEIARLNLDNKDSIRRLADAAQDLMADIRANSETLTTNYKSGGSLRIQATYPRLSKSIIDQIDRVLAEHYGFTEEELDFIINYDIKYRMGRGSEENGSQ